jgi:hypothetical protein
VWDIAALRLPHIVCGARRAHVCVFAKAPHSTHSLGSVPGFMDPEAASAESAIHFVSVGLIRAFSVCLLLPIESLGRCPG